MSTIESARVEPEPGSPADPFRYGWRYVAGQAGRRAGRGRDSPPDPERPPVPGGGGSVTVQFPSHTNDRHYLKHVFKTRVAHESDGDGPVRLPGPIRRAGAEAAGPGCRGLLQPPSRLGRRDARSGRRPGPGRSWWSRSPRPIRGRTTSGPKKAYYHRAGVPLYVIVDARPGPKGRRVKLHGFRHAPVRCPSTTRVGYGTVCRWLTICRVDSWIGEPIGIWSLRGRRPDRRVIEAEAHEGRTGDRDSISNRGGSPSRRAESGPEPRRKPGGRCPRILGGSRQGGRVPGIIGPTI